MPVPIMLVTTKAVAPQTLSARRNWAPASTACCGFPGRRSDRSLNCSVAIHCLLAERPAGDDFSFRLIVVWLVVNQFVVTSHPVGQQRVDPIALAAPAIAAVESIRIAGPFAHRQFGVRQGDTRLGAMSPVDQRVNT